MKKIIILMVCVSFVLSGCKTLENKSLTPEEIVASPVGTYQELEDYYIVSTRKHYENEELTDSFSNREWSAKVNGDVKTVIENTKYRSRNV